MVRTDVRSGLLAGVTSAVIWMAVSLWVTMEPSSVGLGGLLCLVGTTLIATVITGWRRRSVSVRSGGDPAV